MKSILPILIVLAAIIYLPAQDVKTTACDCKDAIQLAVTKNFSYGPTQATVGYGKQQEITTQDRDSEFRFLEEHNSAWYLLEMKTAGLMQFEIFPADTTNDYDFLLYAYNDTSLCRLIRQERVIPIRSNISNNRLNHNKGITGLSLSATKAYHSLGAGEVYSLPVQVNKGDRFMLVLDNVSPKGQGHTIRFQFNLRRVEVKGIVVNDQNVPLVADVKLADSKGVTIAQTTSNEKGLYSLTAAMEEARNYSLTFINDSSFIGSQIINTDSIRRGNSFPDIRVVLPKLKKGAKHPVGNINFYGNEAHLLPQSYASVEALAYLMDKNKKMQIQIEGHVNGAGLQHASYRESYPGHFQELSDDRATTVRDYLVGKGINTERMTTVGLSDRQMLFPFAKNEEEQSANRRVEVKIVSLKGE